MQMALSTQVKESVNQATSSLRDALAFAARSEHSLTINTLADLLARCESLECMDEMMNKFAGPYKSTGNIPSQRGDDTLFWRRSPSGLLLEARRVDTQSLQRLG